MIRSTIFVVSLLLVLAQVANGVELNVPATESVTISNGLAGSRLLLNFGSVTELAGERITSARLILPMSGFSPESGFELGVSPITTPWTSSATWGSPWVAAGGDRDLGRVVTAHVQGGAPTGDLALDVLDHVQAIVDGNVAPYGFMVHPDGELRLGFDADEIQAIGNLQGARLEIMYRSLRAHGVENGQPRFLERRLEAMKQGLNVAPHQDKVAGSR